MRYLIPIVVLALVLSGFSGKYDISDPKVLVLTYYNNHKITTWVNDEPVLVIDNVWTGYNQPFWPFLRKGENAIYFTAERLPYEVTQKAANDYCNAEYPKDENGKEITTDFPFGYDPRKIKEGSTTIKLIKGNIFTPGETVLEWKATEDKQTSPRWSVYSEISYLPSLESYDDIKSIDSETRKQIEEFLGKLQTALDSKNLQIVDLSESYFERIIKKCFGEDVSVSKDIFSLKPYKAIVSPMSDLSIVYGRKTIMVYRPDGEAIFSAGLAPDAPQENGKMYWGISGSVLYFVKDKGILKPLWPNI